jgi:hypothetical protein
MYKHINTVPYVISIGKPVIFSFRFIHTDQTIKLIVFRAFGTVYKVSK